MALVAKSDTSTGSTACTSYVLRSNDLTFMITAPQGGPACGDASSSALPGYDPESAFAFIKAHGLAVRSIGARPSAPPLHIARKAQDHGVLACCGPIGAARTRPPWRGD